MEKTKESIKNKIIKIFKEKRKLTKLQIVKLIFAGISVFFLILGIIFTCIKTPIDGYIYRINTSLEEREETWKQRKSELYDYYDQLYPASHYESRMETSRFVKLLYKISFTNEDENTKQLTIEVFNFTETPISILWNIKFENREEKKYYYCNDVRDQVFGVKQSKSYSVIVDKDFDINDYVVWAISIDDDNDGHKDWDHDIIESYEREMERNKTFSINDDIIEIIGEQPTYENENTEPIPYYMVEIVNARLRYIFCYIFAVVFLLISIFIRKAKSKNYSSSTVYQKSYVPEYTSTTKEVIVKEIHHHTPKTQKVICLYCGSRYNDDLDECPNCGSNKIK